jgi:ammonia channel protein AmtB
MITVMFKWWYTDGWKLAFTNIINRSYNILDKFSVSILLKTLFEPWKQIKSYAGPGSSINDKIYVLFDNAFARTFGFILRINLIILAFLYLFV